MEIRAFAHDLLFTPTLAARLDPPPLASACTDADRGAPRPWRAPARPAHLAIAPKRARRPIPHPDSLLDPLQRARCLHAFANHELMALELMAWAILAYPEAPSAFRRGLVWLIEEEQRHFRLYAERLDALGHPFGSFPLNDHFWRLAPQLKTPAVWVCTINLGFEQANLDHAPAWAEHFARAGDRESAALMRTIEADEIAHVAFGARWLARFTRSESATWEHFVANLPAWAGPERARGPSLNLEARRAAGLGDDFARGLAAL